MNKSRVEALTDGIIAIAATIMVLELKIPEVNSLAGLAEVRHIFVAYLNSFMIIYIVWSMHHDIFQKAKHLSRRTFLVNGVWIFMLTLVPFTTAWVGSVPNSTIPEFLYPLNLLLWNFAFHWLDHQICKDNPGVQQYTSGKVSIRVVMYAVYLTSMALAFIKPILSIYLTGTMSLVVFIYILITGKEQ